MAIVEWEAPAEFESYRCEFEKLSEDAMEKQYTGEKDLENSNA